MGLVVDNIPVLCRAMFDGPFPSSLVGSRNGNESPLPHSLSKRNQTIILLLTKKKSFDSELQLARLQRCHLASPSSSDLACCEVMQQFGLVGRRELRREVTPLVDDASLCI